MRKSAPDRLIEPLLSSAVVVSGAILAAQFVSFYRPWRTHEIYAVMAVTIAAGIWLSVAAVRSRAYRVVWRSVLAASVLLVASVYGYLYVESRAANLPGLSDYIDAPAGAPGDLWQYFRDRDQIPGDKLASFFAEPIEAFDPPDMREPKAAMADAVLAGRFRFLSYPPATLSQDLDWDEDPHGDRTWTWWLHNMSYVAILAERYGETGEMRYLQRAEDLVLDWIADNSLYFFEPPSEFSWYDHSTAFRLMNWLYFWETWSKSSLFDGQEAALVLRSMLAHARRLASDDFYTGTHNHGIDQDRALIAMALVFPELKQAARWRAIALERLETQVADAVSANGVHLEHSPGYHLYGLRQFQQISALLNAWDIDHGLRATLPPLVKSMARYVAHIVQPNGRIVPIGDTAVRHIRDYDGLLAPLADADGPLTYLLTNGDDGRIPDRTAVFRDEGYAVIRDFDGGRLTLEESIYVFFTAAANRGHGHKQADDLSFILSYAGYDLLADPGLYSYKYDAGRKYVTSSLAHNTVAIDGRGFEGWDSGLDAFMSSENMTAIKASHRNYRHFEHSRWLIDLHGGLFILVDTLTQKADVPAAERAQIHQFTQLFHSSSEIELTVAGSGREVWFRAAEGAGGGPLMRIVQLGQTSAAPRITSGGHEPMIGWMSPRHGVLEPAPVAIFQTEGRDATFVSIIELNMGRQEPTDKPFSRSEYAAQISADTISVNWLENNTRHEMILDRDANTINPRP